MRTSIYTSNLWHRDYSGLINSPIIAIFLFLYVAGNRCTLMLHNNIPNQYNIYLVPDTHDICILTVTQTLGYIDFEYMYPLHLFILRFPFPSFEKENPWSSSDLTVILAALVIALVLCSSVISF